MTSSGADFNENLWANYSSVSQCLLPKCFQKCLLPTVNQKCTLPSLTTGILFLDHGQHSVS